MAEGRQILGNPMASITTIDLARLAAQHDLVAALAPEIIPPLLAQLAALQSALAARLLTAPQNGHPPEPVTEDRLLTPQEAATLLSVTPRWLYRHAKGLPFTRRLSRKTLRFSETGLRRWQAARRP